MPPDGLACGNFAARETTMTPLEVMMTELRTQDTALEAAIARLATLGDLPLRISDDLLSQFDDACTLHNLISVPNGAVMA